MLDKDFCHRAKATEQGRERTQPCNCGTAITNMDAGEAFPQSSSCNSEKKLIARSRLTSYFALPPAPHTKSLGNRTGFYDHCMIRR